MKKMNIIKWSLLPVLLGLLVLSSCKKPFLDRQPLGRYIDDDIIINPKRTANIEHFNFIAFFI